MNRFVHYTAMSRQDIEEIFDYFDQHNETVADRFYDAIEKTIQQLVRSPELGEKRDYANPEYANMRVWQVSGFSNYLIFYRVGKTDLTIVRVIHGARDYDTMFNE